MHNLLNLNELRILVMIVVFETSQTSNHFKLNRPCSGIGS